MKLSEAAGAVFLAGAVILVALSAADAHASERSDVCTQAMLEGLKVTEVYAEADGKLSAERQESLTAAIAAQSKAIVQGSSYEAYSGLVERFIANTPTVLLKNLQQGISVEDTLRAGEAVCEQVLGESI